MTCPYLIGQNYRCCVKKNHKLISLPTINTHDYLKLYKFINKVLRENKIYKHKKYTSIMKIKPNVYI